jgi:hypothetical protein
MNESNGATASLPTGDSLFKAKHQHARVGSLRTAGRAKERGVLMDGDPSETGLVVVHVVGETPTADEVLSALAAPMATPARTKGALR